MLYKYTWFILSLLLFSQCQSADQNQQEGNHAVLISQKSLNARQVVEKIKQQVTCDWAEETVDTFKEGDPETAVTGIATTFLATLDVLKRAKAMGLNMVITHEPTFYNHFDRLDNFTDDDIVAAKQKFIRENNMVVWRFHDHIHRTDPDGIYEGIIAQLGWKDLQADPEEYLFKMGARSLRDLTQELKQKYQTDAIRVVGDPEMTVHTAALVLGAPGSIPQIRMLQREEVDVVIGGETHEWETVEYVRDAVSAGKNKALILIGHANSEEAGMAYCAQWLQKFITEAPVRFVPAGDPFWSPQ